MNPDRAGGPGVVPPAAIKGIVFDVDGTLYSQLPLRVIMAALLVLHHLVQPSHFVRRLKIITSYRRAQEELRYLRLENRRCHQEQLRRAAEASGENAEYIEKTVTTWFEEKPLPYLSLCRRRGVVEVVKKLWQMNITLGVLSDYPAREKLRAMGIEEYFSVVVSASDPDVVGFKPGGNGFRVTAEKMGLHPSEVLYVGDRPEVDGVGASRAGMDFVLFGGGRGDGTCRVIDRLEELFDLLQK